MPGHSPNPDAGRRLREVRERLGMSTRAVERLSRQLAEKKQNPDYYISHAWLSEVEKGEWPPGIFKISSLSIIYGYRFDKLLDFYGVSIADLALEQLRLPLPHTHLVGAAEGQHAISPVTMSPSRMEKTELVSRMFLGMAGVEADLFPPGPNTSAIYGYIGTRDYTLFPVIRPGSFVQIDPSRRKIETGRWASEFERPIYFVELRDEYACSWCEEKEGSLLLIPCPRSGRQVRQVRYPAEAEVIGRVTAVTMRIVESRERSAGRPGRS